MALSFSDLDNDLQRSVFAATTLVCLLLALTLFRIVHYIFLGLTALASLYLSYKLFLEPLIKKSRDKKRKEK